MARLAIKGFFSAGLRLSGFVALAMAMVSGPVGASVFSQPPPPFCGKSLNIAAAAPEVLLLPQGGLFDLGTQVYFTMLDFPAGTGLCPAGPYAVDVDVALVCTPVTAELGAESVSTAQLSGGGTVSGAAISLGFNAVTVPVSVPAGPARRCEVDVEATLALADGMVMTASSDTAVCLAEALPESAVGSGAGSEAAKMNQRRRLALRLIDFSQTFARAHSGDQLRKILRVTNNDSAESFDGLLIAEIASISRLPGLSGPMSSGTGGFSLSDPVEGDHPAIALAHQLYQGRVPLPRDPTNPAFPRLEYPLSLSPEESMDIEVWVRTSGLDAHGSAARGLIEIIGQFSDLAAGRACAGFTHGVDTGLDPTYDFPDFGEVAGASAPSADRIRLAGEPRPGEGRDIEVDPSEIELLADAQIVPITEITFSEFVTADLGRAQVQVIPDVPFEIDVRFDLELDVSITGSTFQPRVQSFGPLPGAPTGLDRISPVGTGLIPLLREGEIDSYLELIYQLQVVAIDELGDRRPIRWETVELSKLSGEDGVRVRLGGGMADVGAGSRFDALEILNDFRGFFSTDPEDSLGEIFTDGFESGNTVRWSVAEP